MATVINWEDVRFTDTHVIQFEAELVEKDDI